LFAAKANSIPEPGERGSANRVRHVWGHPPTSVTSEALRRSITDNLALRGGTGSTIAKGFVEAGAAGAAPRTWAAFQATISDSLKYRRAPMINGRGKLSSGLTTQFKIVRGATLNSLATAGLVINLSGCI
jgi:hypothetical protein